VETPAAVSQSPVPSGGLAFCQREQRHVGRSGWNVSSGSRGEPSGRCSSSLMTTRVLVMLRTAILLFPFSSFSFWILDWFCNLGVLPLFASQSPRDLVIKEYEPCQALMVHTCNPS
jgi:hypothetical protein